MVWFQWILGESPGITEINGTEINGSIYSNTRVLIMKVVQEVSRGWFHNGWNRCHIFIGCSYLPQTSTHANRRCCIRGKEPFHNYIACWGFLFRDMTRKTGISALRKEAFWPTRSRSLRKGREKELYFSPGSAWMANWGQYDRLDHFLDDLPLP